MKQETIDTREYMSVLKELVEQGETVSIQVAGWSMYPFLYDKRDTVIFHKPNSSLKKGDIVFYVRDNGAYIMHRICKIHSNHTYDIVGDSQSEIEKNVREDQIFATITEVIRDGKHLTEKNRSWKFYSKIWIHTIPFRKVFYRAKDVIKG